MAITVRNRRILSPDSLANSVLGITPFKMIERLVDGQYGILEENGFSVKTTRRTIARI